MSDGRGAGERSATGSRSPRYGVLAAALLSLELLAGMQTYLLATVVPLVAADLNAHQYYGVITGAAQVATFVTMPLGPWLLRRVPVDRLLLLLTGLAAAGGVVSALAPDVSVFVVGRLVSGLAAGALATVSLAAIVSVLPATWRRLVLAGYNLMWVAASLVGPLYAGWVASTLGWRWALVLYLPLLLVARAVVARQLRGTMGGGEDEPLPLAWAVALAAGVALLSLVGVRALPVGVAASVGVAGAVVAVVAAARLLPAGVFRVRRGRAAAVATMGLVTGAFFGADAIVAIVVHDVMGGDTRAVAVVLGVSGLAWALLGLYTARRPASEPRAYAGRSALGGGLMATGLVAMAVAVSAGRVPLVGLGWAVTGVGMGLVYLDTLNHVVEVPEEVDGVPPARAAGAVVLVEAVAAAVTSTVAAAVLGRAVDGGAPAPVAAGVLVGCALIAAGLALAARRAAGVSRSARRPG